MTKFQNIDYKQITTHMICLTNDKFIDKKKKTPGLRKSKAKPKEMAKNINSVSITVLLFVLLVASTGNFKKKILYRILQLYFSFLTLMNMSTCRNPQEQGSNILLPNKTSRAKLIIALPQVYAYVVCTFVSISIQKVVLCLCSSFQFLIHSVFLSLKSIYKY